MARIQRLPTHVKFFKIICQENLREEKIRLPIDFTQKYERLLSNPVLLKVPDGTKWEVHWKKQEGRVWFKKGWNEFAQYYSLGHGHLLMFKFEVASSEFAVEIFNTRTLEIDYPFRRSANDHRAIAPLHNLQNRNTDVKLEEVVHLEDDDSSTHQMEVQLQEDVNESRGRIPKVEKNPSFRVEMRKSYATERCIAIPEEFARRYLKEGPVRLQVLGVGTWHAEFKFWIRDDIRKYKLQRGWSKFKRENHLKEGDECVFELKESTKLTLTVSVIRAIDNVCQ